MQLDNQQSDQDKTIPKTVYYMRTVVNVSVIQADSNYRLLYLMNGFNHPNTV